jgi:anti-sigma28 factor (negative regulator of flagellin synthesis)
MMIQGINQYQVNEAKYKASKAKPRTNIGAFTVARDSFTPSHKKFEIRQDLVNTVKKKITVGYYNSETVLDDLSNSFAKALNAVQ